MEQNFSGEKKGLALLVLILAILISVSVGLAFSLREDSIEENLKIDQTIKTLIVMEDKNNVLFTDVFVYYPPSRRGTLINILGNVGAIYKSIGRVDRIDAVFTEKGIESYKSEIENLTGQKIPFYMIIKLDDFGELTDMLGGMKIFIPSPVDVSDENDERTLLPSGIVNLDGDKIKDYISYTKADETDDDKNERLQNALVAFFGAISKNTKIFEKKDNVKFFTRRISSNLKENDFYRLITEISNIDVEHLNTQSVTGRKRIVDGKILLFPFYDGQLIKDVFKQVLSTLVSSENTNMNRIYVLEIKNGTSVQGLARNTSALLQSAGYDVLNTTNADSSNYEKTVIINHIGNDDIAKNLGDFIHCTNIVEESVLPESEGKEVGVNVDFTIIIGKDFDGRYVKSTGGK